MLSRTRKLLRGLIRWLEAESTSPAPRRRRLGLESLEDRTAPAVEIWNGLGGNALWSTPLNWAPIGGAAAVAPVNNDTLVLNLAASSTDDIAVLTDVSGLTVDIGAANSIKFKQNLNINGALNLTSGTVKGFGDLKLQDAASSFGWSGGTIGSQIFVGKAGISTVTSISGAGAKGFEGIGSLDNYGSVTCTGGDIALNGSTITNEAKAVFDIQENVNFTDTRMPAAPVPGRIDNYGLFEKTGGVGISTIAANFTNSAKLVLQVGTLAFTATIGQKTGSTTFQGGNLTAPTFNLDGGLFTGQNTFTGDLNNTGALATSTVYAGAAGVGGLTVLGNYTVSSSKNATTQVDVSAAGTVNILTVAAVGGKGGTTTINGGTVAIRRENTYQPAINTTVTFIRSVALAGKFASTNQPANAKWTNGVNTLQWNAVAAAPNYNLVAGAPPAVKGKAFNDANQNHIQDGLEGGIANVAVTLAGSDGSSYTTQTAADGTYEFDGLTLGVTYTVSASTPSGDTLEGYYADDGTPNTTASFTPTSTQPVGNIDAAFVAATGTGTTTSLTASTLTSTVNQPVTFSVSVSPTGGGMGFPSGSVQLYDGTTLLASAALSAGSQASFAISSLAVGSHDITAYYGGNGTYTGSTSPVVTETVQPGPPSTSFIMLSESSQYASLGNPVTFTATVSSGNPSSPPTGTVSFYDNGILMQTIVLTQGMSGMQAALTTSSLAVGNHTITATYNGDANDAPTSASVSFYVMAM